MNKIKILLVIVNFNNVLDLPNSIVEWAMTVVKPSFVFKPRMLEQGTVYVAGRDGNRWGGVKLVKK